MSDGKQQQYQPSIKQHVNGIWGLYLGEQFVAGFPTEVDAEIRLRLVQFALDGAARQASQPSHASGELGQAKDITLKIGEIFDSSSTRKYEAILELIIKVQREAQQAMAEKAAQLVQSHHPGSDWWDGGQLIDMLVARIRSLAGADK